ncbi:MAG: IS30 family transposase [Gemmatimonadales bacterium]
MTPQERYAIAVGRRAGRSLAVIARELGRHRSTVSREVHRNATPRDGAYRPVLAQRQAQNRRHLAHRRWRFSVADWTLILTRLSERWSPEQIAGTLRRQGRLHISPETIYRFIWRNKRRGGDLWRFLRCASKLKRKRYGSYERRGRLAGKRPLADRPALVDARQRIGDWEIDTMAGAGTPACVLSLVERKTGLLLLGKLANRTAAVIRRRAIQLLQAQRRRVWTITADNGTEFHQYQPIERATRGRFYFAPPYQAWTRGTCENTNGLVRQYLPKGRDLAQLTQADCTAIAQQLNQRPRKRHHYLTPEECYA